MKHLALCGLLLALATPALATENLSNVALQQKLQATEARLAEIEARLAEAPPAAADRWTDNLLGHWSERIQLSGLVEVEAGYERVELNEGGSDESSDLVLATVELGVEVSLNDYLSGHVLLLWEEDETEPVDVDEAVISLNGGERLPLYVNAGKMYVPFGRFESHFVSDPLTLELGETNETAVELGFASAGFDLSLSLFNGDVDEIDENNHINSLVAKAVYSLPEDRIAGLALSLGMSWISNLADSDALEEEIAVDALDDKVDGFGAFVSLAVAERLFIEAEYLGALRSFAAGELAFDGGEALRPETWNLEVGYQLRDDLQMAVKYEGGKDLADFLPEEQYGAVVAYQLFEPLTLALEYLYGEFDNDDERDLVTAQLALEF